MARPTNGSNKLLQNLADKIRAELDSLVEQYDVRLADRPGYNRLPAPMRRDLERQLLNLIADALIQGNSRELVEHVRQRAARMGRRRLRDSLVPSVTDCAGRNSGAVDSFSRGQHFSMASLEPQSRYCLANRGRARPPGRTDSAPKPQPLQTVMDTSRSRLLEYLRPDLSGLQPGLCQKMRVGLAR